MLFIRLCYDKPGVESLRDQNRAEHRAYLASGVVKLLQAGPLMDDENQKNIASLMIVEAGSLEEVRRFHDNDPFTKAGIFGDVHIHIWDKHIG